MVSTTSVFVVFVLWPATEWNLTTSAYRQYMFLYLNKKAEIAQIE
jgi:hypothetical protein